MSRQSNVEPVEIEGELKAESAMAYLVVLADGRDSWIPKSKAYNVEKDGDSISMTIPMWLAKNNGLA